MIDYLVTCHLFTAYGNKSPGAITNLRSSLVNNNALGRVCVTSGLHRHLLHAEPKLMSKINEYLNYLSEENSEGEAIDAGFKAGRFIENLDLINEDDCPVLVDVEVPKVNQSPDQAALTFKSQYPASLSRPWATSSNP